ncbi:hypothetical protein L484_001682 [Morus notabilis]|uniref:Reverse transcriptase/retrotransposon-derived protein RNase H-like domain-containing protein n=1 Tax=Morus notabilis TaxID=981085 RepID=W9QL92_9ROSA|nr:hypothetical protein L484_001682 [Morus notabilis]
MLKENPSQWGTEQTAAVIALKKVAQSPPPLKIPSTWKRVLETDASDHYWGAILIEEEKDKKHYCGHASGQFKESTKALSHHLQGDSCVTGLIIIDEVVLVLLSGNNGWTYGFGVTFHNPDFGRFGVRRPPSRPRRPHSAAQTRVSSPSNLHQSSTKPGKKSAKSKPKRRDELHCRGELNRKRRRNNEIEALTSRHRRRAPLSMRSLQDLHHNGIIIARLRLSDFRARSRLESQENLIGDSLTRRLSSVVGSRHHHWFSFFLRLRVIGSSGAYHAIYAHICLKWSTSHLPDASEAVNASPLALLYGRLLVLSHGRPFPSFILRVLDAKLPWPFIY